MQLNLPALVLCLLGSVILCGGQVSVEPPSLAPSTNTTGDLNTNSTMPALSTAGPSNPGPSNPGPSNPGPSNPGPSNPGPSNPGPSTPAGSSQTAPSTETTSVPITNPVGEGSSEGLTSGAIAGIAIGSIAGVAALGGGIFGVLKYTSMI
ncbi:gamete and mating-type specific protein A-like [Clinocottus analis]|uniref:gamete and mating-type specific protein A-like n=1 Tax=Clinocottus analis TaxID=304258 RepID=UPI0035BF29A2